MLVAVALIGAVVALRIAQAQTRTYEISVTPDKVLEGSDATIEVKVTVSQAVAAGTMVYLHIANELDGDGCDIIKTGCDNPASIKDSEDADAPRPATTSGNITMDTASTTINLSITSRQDMKIEGGREDILGTVRCGCG